MICIVNQLNENHWADWYPHLSLLLSLFIGYPDHSADYPYYCPYYLADWYWAELPFNQEEPMDTISGPTGRASAVSDSGRGSW